MPVVNPADAMSFSAFGDRDQNGFSGGARSLLMGDRFLEIEKRASYYDCTQHDRKFWDFDGRPINPRTMQPLLGAEKSWWVPLKMRRPSTPIRLGKVIVDSFTNLLFGENRFPLIRVEGDEASEDWLQTASRVGKLPLKMIQARNYGGAAGSVGLSWCFRKGKPSFEVHKAQNLFVHTWEDRLQLVPEHVSEVYLFSKIKWDGKAFNKQFYWARRDWTPDADVVFKDVIYDQLQEPVFVVDQEKSSFHQDHICHLEWIQNLPSDEMDGEPDYSGLYENFDHADMLMSVITRGAILNLDPTVKLKMDRDEISRMGISKGSDNAIVTGKDGDAEYMELGGTSITAGLELVKEQRRYIFETAQCIVPDPHEVAAQGVSSVAIKAMFAPMLAKTDVLREQYGTALERIQTNMSRVTREKTSVPVVVSEPQLDPVTGQPMTDELGQAMMQDVPAQFFVDLPKKATEEPVIDVMTGLPDASGEVQTIMVDRVLGPGGEITLTWPPYFPPTPQDQAQIVTALQTATGGKAFLSQETATEAGARAFGQDPAEEWRRVQAETASAGAATGGMFDHAAAGGQVSDPNAHPDGGAAAPHTPPPPPLPAHPLPVDDPDADVPVDIDMTGKS